jgi:hypothetical protein
MKKSEDYEKIGDLGKGAQGIVSLQTKKTTKMKK